MASEALLPDGWAKDVRIAVAGGRIASVELGVPTGAGDERTAILTLGMPNLRRLVG